MGPGVILLALSMKILSLEYFELNHIVFVMMRVLGGRRKKKKNRRREGGKEKTEMRDRPAGEFKIEKEL